ncbi:helix-turn-helix domain-containing protein [Streptomyces chryseus]
MRDDAEEFAALLRQLKDRTDRSYGSLARRLKMNTSTLYRYCAGDAVPQDFAPVERLAAFCEATPQERIELHRLWLSAVAARQRVRTAGSAEAAVPAPDGDPDAGGGGAPSDEKCSAEQPGDERDPAGEPAPFPAPRPWYRRRRVLAATSVACALLATVATTATLSDDHSSDADATRSSGLRTAAPVAPHRPAKPPANASPSRSSVSPSSGKRTPAPPATGSTPASAAKPTAGLPLTWSTDSLVWDKGCDHDYVIDKPPAQVPPPPVEQDAGAWAATHDALHGRQTRVQISVQGRSSTAVVLEALRVRIVSRGNPAAGNAYAMDQGCGSDLTPRGFTVNLDADRPIARPKDGADSGHTMPAKHFPYLVSAEDPEVLLVAATTQTHQARWYLELDWSSQGRTGTIRIDDHGRPFTTTSVKGMPHYWYGRNDAGGRAWVPYDS